MKHLPKLTYTNENGESVVFSTLSVFHVNVSKDVDGLNDVKSNINTSKAAGRDGSIYLSSEIEEKDITVLGHIKERDPVIRYHLKRKLNKVLNPHFKGKLKYELGNIVKLADCYVSSSPKIKSGKVLERFIVSFELPSPFFKDNGQIKTDIATWEGLFSFPFVLTNDWKIAERTKSLFKNVYNNGDVKTGMLIVFKANGRLNNPQLVNVNTQEKIKINIQLLAGDHVEIDTRIGQKRVTLLRNGVASNIFRALDIESTFLELNVGDNVFRYMADTNENNLEVSIYHDNFYLGV